MDTMELSTQVANSIGDVIDSFGSKLPAKTTAAVITAADQAGNQPIVEIIEGIPDQAKPALQRVIEAPRDPNARGMLAGMLVGALQANVTLANRMADLLEQAKEKQPQPTGGTTINVGDISGISGGIVGVSGRDFKVDQSRHTTIDRSQHTTTGRQINTGGGQYVEGGIQSSGDVVFGDKKTETVHGDKIIGDISVGKITGQTVAIGHKSQVTVKQGPGAEALAKAFADIYSGIETRNTSQDRERGTDKEDIHETVGKIEKEVTKSQSEVNEKKVERLLKYLVEIAPDVSDVVIACLVNPVLGVSTVIRKIAQKVKDQTA